MVELNAITMNNTIQIKGTPGSKVQIPITYDVSEDTLGMHSLIPCSDTMNTMQDECLTTRVPQHLVDTFGCTVPFYPNTPAQKICDSNSTSLMAAVCEEAKISVSNKQNVFFRV